MNCWSAMQGWRSRHRPSSYLAAMLAGALLHGCAQLERAPEPEPPTESVEPPPAPSAQPPAPPSVRQRPGRTVEPPPAPSVRQRPQPQDAPSQSPPGPADTAKGAQERGRISMYGREFSGKTTASGEPFDPSELTMAHRTLPFGTRVRVTNLENQRSVEVVVNDRGPFVAGRIADLSEAAARRIDMITDGVVDGILHIVEPAKDR